MFCTTVRGGPLKSWNWEENIPINSINPSDLSSNQFYQSTGIIDQSSNRLDKSSTNERDQSTIKFDQFANMVDKTDNDQSIKAVVQSAKELDQSNMELDLSDNELLEGVYFYKITSGDSVSHGHITIIK